MKVKKICPKPGHLVVWKHLFAHDPNYIAGTLVEKLGIQVLLLAVDGSTNWYPRTSFHVVVEE